MARIEDLIDEIADPGLRDEIARQVKLLKSTKRFGLVFEDHVPETVSLHGLTIRAGSIVQERRKPEETTRFRVLSVKDGKATIIPVGFDEPVETVASEDLLVVKAFEEPIFPGLTPVGEVKRGTEDKPAHTVINGENFHALQLLAYTHAGKVDVIYIDPPYNTGARDWKYNNRFVDNNDAWRHSKWLAMMEKRLKLSKKLLKPDGVLVVTIDEHELHHLGMLLESIFSNARRQVVTIVINPSGTSSGGLSRVEEYAVFVMPHAREPAQISDDFLIETSAAKPPAWESLLRRGSSWYRHTRPNLCFPVLVDPDSQRIVAVGDPHPQVQDDDPVAEIDGVRAAWPIRSDGRLGIWRVDRERLMELSSKGYAYVSSEDRVRGTWTIRYLMTGTIAAIENGDVQVEGRGEFGQVILSAQEPRRRAKTVWYRGAHTAGGGGGTQLITALLGRRGGFDFPKSLYAVVDTLQTVIRQDQDSIILDFFAGSGTTLHAVALLNAQDGGNRQCILVTNNDVSDAGAKRLYNAGHFAGDPEFEAEGIFESVTKPRGEAAITGARPDGKPVEGRYLDQYLPDHSYADGFEENVAFFRMNYLEPDLVELGRQYNAIAPLLWMAAGSVGSWEEWDGKEPWSAPTASTYAVLFDLSEAAGFGSMVESRPEITHVWIVTDSHTAFVEASADLPSGVRAGQLYREFLRNFTVNAPGVLD